MKDRLDRIDEKLQQAETRADPLAQARLALQCAAMVLSVPPPDDDEGRAFEAWLRARMDRLQRAIDTGDTSGLQPDDCDIRAAHAEYAEFGEKWRAEHSEQPTDT